MGRKNFITIPSVCSGLESGNQWDNKNLEPPLKICDSRPLYRFQRTCASFHIFPITTIKDADDLKVGGSCLIMYHRLHNAVVAEVMMIGKASGYPNVYGMLNVKGNNSIRASDSIIKHYVHLAFSFTKTNTLALTNPDKASDASKVSERLNGIPLPRTWSRWPRFLDQDAKSIVCNSSLRIDASRRPLKRPKRGDPESIDFHRVRYTMSLVSQYLRVHESNPISLDLSRYKPCVYALTIVGV